MCELKLVRSNEMFNVDNVLKNKSHLTAITRKKPSLPMQYLEEQGLLVGEMLDYGCGRGFDADYYGMDKFDAYFQPNFPLKKYNTVTCNFVLNVIEFDSIIEKVISNIKDLLKEGGKAYITVRRDKFEEGWTCKNTFQRYITLGFPVQVEKKGKWIMYVIEK